MFSYSLLIVSIVLSSIASATGNVKHWRNETKASTFENSSRFSSSCGGSLNATSGVISYKQFDLVEPNEVCIWIVRCPFAGQIRGNVVKHNDSSTLIISNFGNDISTLHYIPDSSYSMSGSVLVITYANSNDTSNTGFYLTFTQAKFSTNLLPNSTSEDHLVSGNSGYIKYPTGKDQYSIREISMFVFEPVRNNNGQLQKTQVLYIRDELSTIDCRNTLTFFTFDRRKTGLSQWRNLGRICGETDTATVSNHDFIVIAFESKGMTVGARGFHLYAQSFS